MNVYLYIQSDSETEANNRGRSAGSNGQSRTNGPTGKQVFICVLYSS